MKKCSFCGELNPDGTIVCPWCGRRDSAPPPAATEPVGAPRNAPSKAAAQSRDARSDALPSAATHERSQVTGSTYGALLLGVAILAIGCLLGRVINWPTIGPRTPTPKPLPPTSTQPPPLPSLTPTASPSRTPIPSPTPSPTPAPPHATVRASYLNVRDGPGTGYAVKDHLAANDVVLVLGRAIGLPWIKVALPSGSNGWVSAKSQHVVLDMPLGDLPPAFFRAPTGIIQSPTHPHGLGELRIANQWPFDALIVIVRSGATYAAAYVREGESFSITHIPDGYVNVYYSVGSEWQGEEFNALERRARFRDPLDFATDGYYTTVWEIVLSPSSRGNAPVDEVDASGFPSISPDITLED